MLRQKNESNSLTVLKKQKELANNNKEKKVLYQEGLFAFFFLKKEEPALVGTPIHHTLLYAKMFYKMGLAYSYTYRATETEPTGHRIEKRKWGLNGPKTRCFLPCLICEKPMLRSDFLGRETCVFQVIKVNQSTFACVKAKKVKYLCHSFG